jgi:hypothetical protein
MGTARRREEQIVGAVPWARSRTMGSTPVRERDTAQAVPDDSGIAIDYDTWSFYRDISRARRAGGVRIHVLGVTLDALSLNASIATVAVIDAPVFDRLFQDAVSINFEGQVVSSLHKSRALRGSVLRCADSRATHFPRAYRTDERLLGYCLA